MKMEESHLLFSAVYNGNLDLVKKFINPLGQSYMEGYDLLRVALECNRREVAKVLLLNGSKVNVTKTFRATPLHFAAKSGDVEIVAMLLNRHAQIDARDGQGQTSLHVAVEKNQIEVVKLLLKRGACIDATDRYGITPLHVASNKNHPEIVKILLTFGGYVNSKTYITPLKKGREGYTPLHYAVEIGNREITNLLLKCNADVNIKADYGTPICTAVMGRNQQIILDLLNHGASVNNVCTSKGYTPLHVAVANGRVETARLLLTKGANVNSAALDNSLPLYVAAKHGQKATVKLLLEHGAHVDPHNAYGETVLYCAVKLNRSDIVEEILKFGPDLNNESNRSSFYWAIEGDENKYRKIITDLVEYGFTVSSEDINNRRLLHSAVKSGYLKIVEDLLRYGADVNTKSECEEHYTLLHTAAKYMQTEVAGYLINYEANVNATDKDKRAPIFYAIQHGDLRMTELLLANGANVEDGTDLLNSAVTKGFVEIVEILLQHDSNIDVNSRDKFGHTPLYCTVLRSKGAAVKGDIAKLLLSRGAKINDEPMLLYAALTRGYVKLAEVLLQYNIEVNSVCDGWRTPLHAAVDNGYENITRLLLNKGAMVNIKVGAAPTTLYIATSHGHKNIVEILLEHGADVNSGIDGETTPLHVAAQEGDVDIVNTLIKHGANIDALDKDGSTAFHLACFIGHEHVVEALLRNGCDINILNKDNLTALDCYVAVPYYESRHPYWKLVFESTHTDKIFVRQIVKLMAENFYVHEKCLETISAEPNLRCNYVSCEREIEEMKNEKIHNTNVSFYDILTKGVHQLAMYASNENIVEVLGSQEYEKMFPIYADVLNEQFMKGQKRQCLLKPGVRSLNCLFGYELPHLIVNKILSYLSDLDLQNLINAYDDGICGEN